MPQELPKPPAADDDDEAFELLRVWAAGGEQHVAIHSGLEGGPAAFGYMIAQLLQHGAMLYAKREGRPTAEVLAEIRESFDLEWEIPTGDPSGEIGE